MSKKAAVKAPFGIQQPSQSVPTTPMTEADLLQCLTESICHQHALHSLHSSKAWAATYNAATNPALKRALRVLIQMQTINACLRGRYYLDNGTAVDVDKKNLLAAARETKVYLSDFNFEGDGAKSGKHPRSAKASAAEPTGGKTEVLVLAGDSLDGAFFLQRRYKATNIGVLNMASMSKPGGGYLKGAAAQEESLVRRTNLFQCLDDPYRTVPTRQWSYPLPEFGGLHTPNAVVIRGSQSSGYAFIHPKTLSFVAVAAYKDPPTEPRDGRRYIQGKLVQHIKRKIEAMLSIFKVHQHTHIVLGAWGCGCYGNPAHHIASLFKEVLSQPRFEQFFKVVAFAIVDDTNAFKDHNEVEGAKGTTGEGNLSAFASAFKVHPLQLDLATPENQTPAIATPPVTEAAVLATQPPETEAPDDSRKSK